MLVAVFGDSHAHGEALEAVIAAADAAGADQLWSLGDMIGGGPDPERVVELTRERCAVALLGNHDYVATGSVEPERLAEPGSGAHRSLELARERLSGDDVAWLRTRKPAARRGDVRAWHGSPRNPVWEFVGPANATACLAAQRSPLGLIGHTHAAMAWQEGGGKARRVDVAVGEPLHIGTGKWLLNPGAVGAPAPTRHRLDWWDALDEQAAEGAFWLLLDLDRHTATWLRASYDPRPARARAAALGLEPATLPAV